MDMTGLSPEVDTSHIQLEGKGHGQRREKCFFYYKRIEEMTMDKAPHENPGWPEAWEDLGILISSSFSAHEAIQCQSKPIQALILPFHWSTGCTHLKCALSCDLI